VTSDRFARIETLYHAARARPGEARAAYLAEACGDDERLRREVESLLADPSTASFLRSAVVEAPALAEGTVIGVYRIVARIGAGGMGEVYCAHDTKLRRNVAVKVLPAALANDRDRLARLEREARLLAALNHPNIAHVYGLEESNGTRALVMELVDGETLADRLMHGAIPVKEALAVARQLADALAAAHDRGIIHRDLKPANVKLRPDGTVKVLDFGLAKAMDSVVGSSATEQGAILGTAAYMSPEQASGKPVDRRTDLWAFGVVLMEMLTGRRVFEGESTAHVLSSVLKSEPDWSSLPADVPVAVRRLLRRCLAKDPAHRWDSASVARLDLENVDSGTDAVLRPARYSRSIVLAAAVTLVLLTVVVETFLWTRSGVATAAPTVIPLTSYEGVERFPSFSRDGTQVAFSWNGEKQDNFSVYVKLVGSEASPFRLTSAPDNDIAPSWSPDDSQIAFVRIKRTTPGEASLYVSNPLAADTARKVADFRQMLFNGPWSSTSWSPDGKWLAVAVANGDEENAIVLYPVEGGNRRQILAAAQAQIQFGVPAFSPDGAQLAYIGCKSVRSCDVYLVDLAADLSQRGEPRTLTHEHAPVEGLAWSPDGRSLIYASEEYLQRVSTTGMPLGRVELAGTSAAHPAIARRGNRMAWTRSTFDFDLLKLEEFGADAAPDVFLKSTLDEYEASFSQDGRQIAFVSNRGGRNYEIWIANRDGSHPLQLTRHAQGWKCGTPRWSKDGSQIVYDAAGPNGVWHVYLTDVATGGPPRPVVSEEWEQNAPIWSHDEKWIYYSRAGGTLGIWRTAWPSGTTEQLVPKGATVFPSADDKSFFYSKGDGFVWLRSLADGSERPLVAKYGRCYFPVTDGIYFVPPPNPDRPRDMELRFFELSTRKQLILGRFKADLCKTVAVSPDRKTILLGAGTVKADLMLMEHFR
jgi:serine/threonine protein kinase